MAKRAAGAKHVDELVLETGVTFAVDLIERIDQAVAEGVGIHIERRADEVGDVRPVVPVLVVEAERRAEAFALHLHPDIPEPFRRQLAFAAHLMNAPLELMEGDLPDHGVEHVFDLAGEQPASEIRVVLTVEKCPKHQHFAEHRSGFGEGQRRVRHQRPLVRRQNLVDAMPKLVGKRGDVPGPTVEVQQDVRVDRGHRGMAERTRILSRPRRRIDPAVLEKASRDFRKPRIEPGEGAKNGLARLVPGETLLVIARQRRVAVPVIESVAAEPAGLEPVVAMRELFVGIPDRCHQRLDHLVLDHVGQVPVRDRLWIAAPFVLDLLVLGQGVGDQGKDTDSIPEPGTEGLGAGAAHGLVRIVEQIERIGQRQVGPVDPKARLGHRLIEQPHPSAGPGDPLLVKKLLEIVLELVRLEHADVAQPRAVTRGGLIGELRFQGVFIDAIEFEREKQGGRRDLGIPLLHRLHEAALFGVAHVAGEHQLRIGHHLVQPFDNLLVRGNRGAQLGAGQLRQAVGVGVPEGFRFLPSPVEILFEFRRIRVR